jgi:hypothetical protein
MKNITDTLTPAVSEAVAAYNFFVLQATLGQVEQASVWYHEAQEVAEDVAELLEQSLEVGASVVSAFSPRERWSSNVAKAFAFASGKPVSGLSNNLRMANKALELGFDALKGDKTNAFARAIAGDTNAVVIDTWMIKAAGLDSSKGVNKTQYRELTDAVRIVSFAHGLTPRTCQALIWIVKRGSAE